MIPRNQSLDVLRGIAVLMVIVHHYFPPEVATILHSGGAGVELFFVLSGYLICGLLFNEIQRTRRLQIVRFLIRRGLKIYPAFYVFLILTIPIVLPQDRIRLIPEFFFLQQYMPHVWQHTWSLSVEETFYVCAPILLALLYKLRAVHLFPIMIFPITVAVVVLRLAGTHPIKIEGLALGSLIAYAEVFYSDHFRRFIGWWLVALAVVFLIPALTFHREGVTFETDTLAFGCLVCLAAVHPRILPQLKPVAAIGRYSYSIYLWHMPIALFSWIVLPHSLWGEVLNLVLSVSVGVGMSKAIEMPLLQIRDRLLPGPTQQVRGCAPLASDIFFGPAHKESL